MLSFETRNLVKVVLYRVDLAETNIVHEIVILQLIILDIIRLGQGIVLLPI